MVVPSPHPLPDDTIDLQSFLLSAFTVAELEFFAKALDPELALDLAPSMAARPYCAALVDSCRRHGLLDDKFFRILLRLRPRRAPEIEALGRRLGISWTGQPSHAPSEHAAGTPSGTAPTATSSSDSTSPSPSVPPASPVLRTAPTSSASPAVPSDTPGSVQLTDGLRNELVLTPEKIGPPRNVHRMGGKRKFYMVMLIGAVTSAGIWALWWWKPTPPITSSDDILTALADVAPMHFVALPGGSFDMGSPKTERDRFIELYPKDSAQNVFADESLHLVTVESFGLAETEVTNAQWKAVMGAPQSNCHYGCEDDHPVQGVSWLMAIEFLNRLTDRENERSSSVRRTRCYERVGDTWRWVKRCTGYRLPSEAEWEYAARAGTKTTYSFGDTKEDLCRHANGADRAWMRAHPGWDWPTNDCDDGVTMLARVGTYPENQWGLSDMHGNVWEWVWGPYDDDDIEVTVPPKGRANTVLRMLRGGSFRDGPWWIRSALRYRFDPRLSTNTTGFRCARG
jgi:sulfatase modifying factor 1